MLSLGARDRDLNRQQVVEVEATQGRVPMAAPRRPALGISSSSCAPAAASVLTQMVIISDGVTSRVAEGLGVGRLEARWSF